MKFSAFDIAQMVDLSAVRANDSDETIEALVQTAQKYHTYLVTTLPATTVLARKLLGENSKIGLSGNIGFPSGGQTTSIKVAEAKELLKMGCTELDMVINIGKLISAKYDEALDDIHAVVEAANGTPLKVILECHYLNEFQILKGCDLVMEGGANFVKTGTGWTPTGATPENVSLIKSRVEDRVQIKASGGIRTLDTIVELYKRGARRFGIGIKSAPAIFEACNTLPGGVVEF